MTQNRNDGEEWADLSKFPPGEIPTLCHTLPWQIRSVIKLHCKKPGGYPPSLNDGGLKFLNTCVPELRPLFEDYAKFDKCLDQAINRWAGACKSGGGAEKGVEGAVKLMKDDLDNVRSEIGKLLKELEPFLVKDRSLETACGTAEKKG
ncbi:MAG: hypothetical protein Q9212_001533 [Teloschistes hypoglaucus]